MSLWSSSIDLNDWKDYLEEVDPDNTLTTTEKYELISEMLDTYLDDERLNLSIQLDNPILIIANIGLWYGRRQGYKIINSGKISDILYSDGDEVTWYADRYNVRSTVYHHDGTNYLLYREIKPNVNIDNLLNKIYSGKPISSKTLSYYTRSIRPHVAKVYGW